MSQIRIKHILAGAAALAAGLTLMADDYDIQYPGPGETVTVSETLVATNIMFGADGYKLAGTGAIKTPNKAGVGALSALNVTVPHDATAEISVPVQNVYLEDFRKYGDGNLVLSDFTGGYLFRTAVYGGTLTFRDVQFDTAKFQQYPQNAAPVANLVFDGATVRPYNNNTLLGEGGFLFNSVAVEDGGLALGWCTTGDRVGWVNLNHRLSGVGAITKLPDATYDLRIQNAVNDLTGGWNLFCGRTYLEYAGGLGTGPVTVSNAQFYANSTMEITNRIVVASNGKVGLSSAAEQLTISDVGFTADNAGKKLTLTVGLGGSAETPRTVHVKSGETPSEIGGYVLEKGESPYDTVVSLTADGDTLKATANASSRYIASPDGEAVLHVGANGVTFDTNGSSFDLGATIDVSPVVQTIPGCEVLVGSFEDDEDNDGWAWHSGTASPSSISNNDGPFVASDRQGEPANMYYTPAGSKFAVIRPNGGYVEHSFEVPESGDWQIAFLIENRAQWAYDEGELGWSLILDPGDGQQVLREMAAEPRKHSFSDSDLGLYMSPVFHLDAGETHVLRIVTGMSKKSNLDALLVDAVRVVKDSVDRTVYGTVAKTGAGTLSLSGLETSGDVAVNGGTLALTGGAFSSNTVSVASGATLKFLDKVAIVNSSFEDGVEESADASQVSAGFAANATVPGWKFTRNKINTQLGLPALSGWQRNGGSVSKNNVPKTENGTHTAFLRPATTISTSVTIPAAGTYALSFEHAVRHATVGEESSWGYLLPITVELIDDRTSQTNTVVYIPPRAAPNYTYTKCEATVELTAGAYTLAFTTGDGGTMNGKDVYTASGPMVFIDAVSLVKTDGCFERPAEDNTVWNFERGATFDIGSFDVDLGTAFVDGVQIRGGKSAFRAAGLNVVGSGKLTSQRPTPIVIIIR